MNWTRRPEVWVLLLASVAAVFWALKPGADFADWESEAGSVEEPASVEGKVKLLGGVLVRDFGNARLDLDVRIKNDGIHPLLLMPPKARLFAGTDGAREVPPFFLPAERPPEAPPKSTTVVKLRYWLEAADLSGPLALDVDGEKVSVKSAAAFDLKSIENQKSQTLRGAVW